MLAGLYRSDHPPTALENHHHLPALSRRRAQPLSWPPSRSPGSMSLQTDGTTRKISEGPCNDAYTASLKCECGSGGNPGRAGCYRRPCWRESFIRHALGCRRSEDQLRKAQRAIWATARGPPPPLLLPPNWPNPASRLPPAYFACLQAWTRTSTTRRPARRPLIPTKSARRTRQAAALAEGGPG